MAGEEAELVFAEELRMFLAPRHRGDGRARVRCDGTSTLAQDRGLLRRRSLWLGAYVRGADPDDQLRDVLNRFAPPLSPWTRCTACNGLLAAARKADVERLLLPGTRRTYQDFARCAVCGRVYWRGAHAARLAAIVDRAARIVAAARLTPCHG